VNVNLDGAGNNSVYLVEHIEPTVEEKIKSRTEVTPFNGGKEGYADWVAERFTMLRIVNDKIKNQRGDALAYDLMPVRMGNARHHGGDGEVCTHHDFWVSRHRPDLKKTELRYPEVPKYVSKGESIMNTDVVIWHSTPAHHEPRLEDGKMMKDAGLQGVTHVMWAGFLLRPRNLWEHTPLYPYKR
jgi:Cu2+-containing amine oxidase